MTEIDYRTPDGRRALFCKTVFIRARQHLSLDGLFPTTTACGHPVGDWSTGEMRTLIGITCRTCIRNVIRYGRVRPTLFAWLMIKLAPLMVELYDRKHPPQSSGKTISTDELFDQED